MAWKQTLFERGWADAFSGSAVSSTLCATEGPSAEIAEALQALWAEVAACQEPGASVDYDACLAALE